MDDTGRTPNGPDAGTAVLVPAEWPVACIGPGRVGTALTRALAARGFPVTRVGGGSGEWARRLADEVGAEVIEPPYIGLGAAARLILVTTPDRLFTPVAEELGKGAGLAEGTLLLHTSATEPAEILRPAAAGRDGVLFASIHPMRPFPDRERGPEQFQGTVLGVEGSGEGGAIARGLALLLGGHVVEIPVGGKAFYHAAGVMAATGVMGLARAGQRMAADLGLDASFVEKGIVGGMRAALQAVADRGLPRALTGPISRGDADVVARHLEAVTDRMPDLAELYRELARINLEMAEAAGVLEEKELDALRKVIQGDRGD